MNAKTRKWKSIAAKRICDIAGSRSVEQAVVEIARRLTEGLDYPPIDLNAILPRVHIAACRAEAGLTVAGELRRSDDGLEIVYAEAQPMGRRRFTIAHEISHAVFEGSGPQCPRRGTELEKICDMLASEILIPRYALSELLLPPLNMEEISRLAKLFDVSLTAMAIRCSRQFGLVTFQVESDELTWAAGAHGKRVERPQLQLRRLAREFAVKQSGQAECWIDLQGNQRRRGLMQWIATGPQRKLFVLLV